MKKIVLYLFLFTSGLSLYSGNQKIEPAQLDDPKTDVHSYSDTDETESTLEDDDYDDDDDDYFSFDDSDSHSFDSINSYDSYNSEEGNNDFLLFQYDHGDFLPQKPPFQYMGTIPELNEKDDDDDEGSAS